MQNNALLFLKDWFHQYVQGFYSTDEQLHFHVRLKEEHTLRVLQHAGAIAKWLTLAPEQLQLAEIAALLHDIGRFSQYQTYRTFNDALSVNHAQLGLTVLDQSDILTGAGLSVHQQNIVKKAVLYHNRRCLPTDVGDDCCLLSKITRDADKLDIFSMLVTDDEDNRIPQSPELKHAPHYSLNIIEDLLQGRLVKPADIKTSADLMLFRLSWIYDIYFTYSFYYIQEQQYVEKLIGMLPATDDIQRVHQYIKQYIEENVLGFK
ncbi:MAG: metal dependent phosphohydrolase [Firmicutes bacterium]|nr:metal dependent phosphohydrolase [Bacillota bacterium]